MSASTLSRLRNNRPSLNESKKYTNTIKTDHKIPKTEARRDPLNNIAVLKKLNGIKEWDAHRNIWGNIGDMLVKW